MPTYTARPTVYAGTQMRSRLEASFAEALDGARITWVYEPMCYASARGQYLPDFVIASPVGLVFVEVKPTREKAEAALPRMEIIRASVADPEGTLLIAVYRDARGRWLGCSAHFPGRVFLVIESMAKWGGSANASA